MILLVFFCPVFILRIVIFTLKRVVKFTIAADGHKNLVTNLTDLLGLVNRLVYFWLAWNSVYTFDLFLFDFLHKMFTNIAMCVCNFIKALVPLMVIFCKSVLFEELL